MVQPVVDIQMAMATTMDTPRNQFFVYMMILPR